MRHHDCDRFRASGLRCPFRRFEPDEEQDDDDEQDKDGFPRFVIPARRERDLENNLSQLRVVQQPAIKEALERLAAIQNRGELESIPKIGVPNFPLSGRGHPEIIAVLSAIALMKFFGKMRSMGLGTTGPVVQAGERQLAKGLQKVVGRASGKAKSVLSPGQGRPLGPGRGGFLKPVSLGIRRMLFDPGLAPPNIPPGGGPK